MMQVPRKRFTTSFKTKKAGDKARLLQKFLDTKKDCAGRYKALKTLIDGSEIGELQKLFKEHFPHVIYVFYENFLIIESTLKASKATKALKEDVDHILVLLERILVLLQDLLHSKWQLNCLGRIMKKLLHPGNTTKVRREGVRLFLLWFQALRENATEEQIEIFKSLIPGLLRIKNSASKADIAKAKEADWVQGDDILPLLVTGEKPPENVHKYYLDLVLQCIVNQIALVEASYDNRVDGFRFVFNQFKIWYLPALFPNLSMETDVYKNSKPVIDINSIHADERLYKGRTVTGQCLQPERTDINILTLRETFLRWIIQYIKTQNEVALHSTSKMQHEQAHAITEEEQTARFIYVIIKEVLFSSRDNINLIHELFRQCYLLPISSYKIIYSVIQITKSWILSNERMTFMCEPQSPSDNEDVRAGLQPNLRLFATFSSNFLMLNVNNQSTKDQEYIVRCILEIYVIMATKVEMTCDTWEQLLTVLLVLASKTMNKGPFPAHERSVGGVYAKEIARIVLTSWTDAASKVSISIELWNELLNVMTALASWPEVVKEWQAVMKNLIKKLARYVYHIDFNNMPLHRLSEQKAKKKRKIGQIVVPNQTAIDGTRKLSLEPPQNNQFSKEVESVKSITVHRERSGAMDNSTGIVKDRNVTTAPPSQLETPLQPDIPPCNKEGHNQSKLVNDQKDEADRVSESSVLSDNYTVTEDRIEDDTKNTDVDSEAQLDDNASTSSQKTSSALGDDISTNSASEKCNEESMEKGIENNAEDSADSKSIEPVEAKKVDASYTNEISVDNNPDDTANDENEKDELDEDKELDDKAEADTDQSIKEIVDKIQDSKEDNDQDIKITEDKSRYVSPLVLRKMFIQEQDSVPPSPIDGSPDIASISDASHNPQSHSPFDAANLRSNESLYLESVVAGGNQQGWSPVSSVVIFQRMLGCLGNLSKIKDPSVHSIAMDALSELWRMLEQIRENQGISEDNKSTPPIPQLLPPMQYFASWVFQSCTLGKEFKSGQVRAYALLSYMTVRRQDMPLSDEYLAHFYRLLHSGLTGNDQDITNVVIENCYQIYSYDLRGSSILLLDFIHAACTVLDNQEMTFPRFQAVALLGSLISFLDELNTMPILQAGAHGNDASTDCITAREEVADILLKVSREEISSQARCTGLNSIGIYVLNELEKEQPHSRIKECFNVLLAQLRFLNNVVAAVAIDNLRMLSYKHEELAEFDKSINAKIIESLCASVVRAVIPKQRRQFASDMVLISLLLCLLEWLMVIPQDILVQQDEGGVSLFHIVSFTLRAIIRPDDDAALKELKTLSNVKSIPIRELKNGNLPSKKSSEQVDDANSEVFNGSVASNDSVRLAATFVMSHFLNYHGHFPFCAGASLLDAKVKEYDDNPRHASITDLTPEIFASPNIQFFVFNNKSIITLVEIPAVPEESSSINSAGLTTASTNARVIIRDIAGKYAWDTNTLYGLFTVDKADSAVDIDCFIDPKVQVKELDEVLKTTVNDPVPSEELNSPDLDDSCKIENSDDGISCPVFAFDNFPESEDRLEKVLQYIGSSSEECLLQPGVPLNSSLASLSLNSYQEVENRTACALLKQAAIEDEFLQQNEYKDMNVFTKLQPTDCKEPSSPFYHCRFILNQLGYLSWENRSHFDLLKRSDMLLRELKNLDNRNCRETHKIAVIYVAEGQEDKRSIFSNLGGSQDYEEFIAGLAWEVDLSSHVGFLGGLQQNESTGVTAPYFATSTTEVIFHVATRMPSSDEDMNKKLRHLGNDEIHIVWSEHTRDYRRGIINTEFGDVIIVIYPLRNGLYKIQIDKKPEIPLFGPLFNGAIVNKSTLPLLVRATAVNASRAKRSRMSFYQLFFEERDRYIANIAKSYKDKRTFESFMCDVMFPVFPKKDDKDYSEIIKDVDEKSCDSSRTSSTSTAKDVHATVV